MSELYIEPEWKGRNLLTGKFLKKCIPHNKGKKMHYKSSNTKNKSIINLKKGQGTVHNTGAGLNKKAVVMINDGRLIFVFKSISETSKKLMIGSSYISRLCSKKTVRKNGFMLYFESDPEWYDKINYDL